MGAGEGAGAPLGRPLAAEERPATLVWWSDAGDIWGGGTLASLLAGLGPRRCRNLGGGYYMTTLDGGPAWAAAAAARLGEGPDPSMAARQGWVNSTASVPGSYGLFLRWAGDDDEQALFDVPAESYDDPPGETAATAGSAAAAAAPAHVMAHVPPLPAEDPMQAQPPLPPLPSSEVPAVGHIAPADGGLGTASPLLGESGEGGDGGESVAMGKKR
ncbi:unnamed protein product, partial [Discosporangium mesarthrocarpum]